MENNDWDPDEQAAKIFNARKTKDIIQAGDLEPDEAYLKDHGLEPDAVGHIGSQQIKKHIENLAKEGDWEEIEQITKAQVVMDSKNAKFWRSIGKDAAKNRRKQAPIAMRIRVMALKILGLVVILLLVLGVIGALSHP